MEKNTGEEFFTTKAHKGAQRRTKEEKKSKYAIPFVSVRVRPWLF
jgi:hypothetical protein